MNKFDISKFDDNTNYVIEASAGTGKTYNIVEIVKKLVNENNEDLNKILIVTYTEKAAGELKDRIRGAIKNKNIDVDNAPIYTIHSFCQNTIKEFGLSANLPLQLEVIDDYELKKFVKRYIREGEILEDFSYCYALRKNVTKSSAKSFDIGKVEEVLIQGVKKYYLNMNNEEDSSIVSITNFNYNGFFQLIKDISEANSFEDLCSKNETIRKYYVTLANSNFQKSKEFANTLEDDITEIYLFSGSKFKTNYFNKASQEDQEAFKFFDEFKKNIEQNLQLCFAVKYIKDFYIKWQKYKEQNKSQNFDDMIRYVREAIINNENFKTILKQKYRRAIIDEFQDTNQKQFDIFKSIFLEDDNENGKHNIIVVGDPKQSIYSFQGADVNVYEKAVNEIVLNGGIKTQLSKNYRSTKNMVESCNDLFKYYNFDKTEFNNCEYLSKEKGDEDIHDVMYENNDVKAFWIAVDDDNREVDEYDFSEIVVQKIIDCCKKDENGKTKLQIRHKNKEFRNVSFKDFAVLTKTGSEVSPLEKALKNAGIPYLRYKDKKLFQGKECVDWICILNALTVIDYKGYNRNIMKKALFTNFFGHSLEILNSDYFNSDDRKDIYLLNEWKSLAYNKKWEDLIDSIIMDSKLESNLRTLKEIQTFAIYKQIGNYCIEFLTENNSLEKLVRMLTNLSDNGGSDSEEGEFIIEKSTNFDCVQIMTMHASKGLQFPIVIGLGGYKGPSNLSKAWTYHEINKQTQEENLILTFSNDNKIIEKEEIAEWKRLFYVAYTRAEFVLMLPYYKKFGLDKKNSKTKNDKTEEINFLRFSIESLIKNDKLGF